MLNKSKKWGAKAYVAVAVGTGLLLSGCSAIRDDEGRPLTTLNPKGEAAQTIDDLIVPVFLVAGIVFLLVEVGAVVLAIYFRKRKNEDEQKDPVQNHGNPRLEWTWTIIPAFVLAILAVFNVQAIWEIEEIDDDVEQEISR